jgi:hypothetical protein
MVSELRGVGTVRPCGVSAIVRPYGWGVVAAVSLFRLDSELTIGEAVALVGRSFSSPRAASRSCRPRI